MTPTKRRIKVTAAETYEFLAFPVDYLPAYRWQKNPGHSYYRGWRYGPLVMLFTFGSAREAIRAVDRLRRIYQMTKRTDLLKNKKLLKIERVERSSL